MNTERIQQVETAPVLGAHRSIAGGFDSAFCSGFDVGCDCLQLFVRNQRRWRASPLTADPVEEVKAGYEILRSLGLRQRGPELISCPTCGRCRIDIIRIANRVQSEVDRLISERTKLPHVKIAVMGCVVNGPGEAREADVGIAGGRNSGTLFRKGRVIRKVKEEDMVRVLMSEVKKLCSAKKGRQ